VCWFVGGDILTGHVLALVVNTASLTPNKSRMETFRVPVNPGRPGKWPLKWREYYDTVYGVKGGVISWKYWPVKEQPQLAVFVFCSSLSVAVAIQSGYRTLKGNIFGWIVLKGH